MTKIIFYQKSTGQNEKRIAAFSFDGHAGYADSGDDIVCAALSVLVINTLNSIEAFTEDVPEVYSDEETGSIRAEFPMNYGRDTDLLIRSLILGVKQISERDDYRSYVELIFEEV